MTKKRKRDSKGRFISTKSDRDESGRFVSGNSQSFKEHPDRINREGYWNSEDSVSFQYKYLMKKTVKEFEGWVKDNPESERTMAQEIAYQAVLEAKDSLAYLKEITDRTEGKAPQFIDLTNKGERFSSFEDAQIKKIASRIAKGRGSDGDTSGKKTSN